MSQRNLVLFSMSAMLSIHAILSAGVGSNLKQCLSMDDLVVIQCPEEQPFKCAPCGACCRGSEFCYSGLCKSCFPLHLQKDERLAWCRSIGQYNTSAMTSPMCRLACQDVFNSTELAGFDSCQHEDRSGRGDTGQSQPNVTNADSDHEPPKTAATREDSSSGSDTVTALCVTIVVLLVLALIGIALVLYVLVRKKKSANSGEFECCKVIRDRASQIKRFVCRTRSAEPLPEELELINDAPSLSKHAQTQTDFPSSSSMESVDSAHDDDEESIAPLDKNLSVTLPQGESKSQSHAESDVPVQEPARTALTTRSLDSRTGPSSSAHNPDQGNTTDKSTVYLTGNPEFTESLGKKALREMNQLKRENPDT